MSESRSHDKLTFGDLRAANVSRAKKWGDFKGQWTGVDWSNAMCGEAGEAANIVKKLRRHECGLRNIGDASPEQLIELLGSEIADVVTYADLLAAHYDLDLGFYVVDKFNRVSEKQGFPQRLLYGSAQ